MQDGLFSINQVKFYTVTKTEKNIGKEIEYQYLSIKTWKTCPKHPVPININDVLPTALWEQARAGRGGGLS